MRRIALLLATISALALAGTAGADQPSPLADDSNDFLVASQSGGGVDATLVGLLLPAASPADARVYVPAGYTIDTAARGPIGAGLVVAGTQPYEATVEGVDPASLAANPDVAACAPGPHAAAWTISLSSLGQTVTIPLLVDPTTGTDTALGAYEIHLCVPAAVFGPSGSPLHGLLLVFRDGIHAATDTGFHVWHAFVAPFAADGKTPDTSATYDFQAEVPVPTTFSFHAKVDRRTHSVMLSGKYTQAGGPPPAGVKIVIGSAPTKDQLPVPRAHLRVAADGTFHGRFHLPHSEYFFAEPAPYHQPCTTTAPAGCRLSVTPIDSAQVHAVIR